MNFAKFSRTRFFHRIPLVPASEKLKAEAVVRRWSVKKVFLEISQNSQEDTCTRNSFLLKLKAWPANLLKRVSGTGIFP